MKEPTAIDYAAIGARVRRLRKQRRMTQAELGSAVGLSAPFIGHIERGTRKASIETVLHIAQVLEASVDFLLTGVSAGMEPAARNARILQELVRVLYKHADEWLQEE